MKIWHLPEGAKERKQMDEFNEKWKACQRGYAQINLDAIVENMRSMKRHIGARTKMLGVVKADGYGHGGIPVARCLEGLDFVYGFAVATAQEAFELRLAGIKKPVLVLGYTFPDSYERFAGWEIRPAVFREDSLKALSQGARAAGKRLKVHVKVDTGMSRIGVTPDDAGLSFVHRLSKEPGIEIEGIFTHFAKADIKDKTSAKAQLSLFKDFLRRIEEELGMKIPLKHCANSAGILELREADMDLVRAGIALYGLYPSEEMRKDVVALHPALSWYSTVIYLKTIKKGQSVGYGSTFTAKQDTRVATVPIGYADGYPRSLSGKGYVLIKGKRAPILGRICMDQFMVDVSEIPEAAEGDRVTLLGVDGTEQISAEALGERSGRFHYELVCDIGKRIPRVYLQGGEKF